MDKEERYNYVFEQYDGDSFIYDLKEDKRIDDLSQCAYILNKYEAKLAESEKNYNDSKELWAEQFHSLTEQINILEQKLAEYEEIKKKYKTIFLDRFVDAKVEDARIWKEKYDQLKKQLQDALKDFNDIQEENDKLAQQLQEEKNRSKKLNHEAQKYYEDAYCNGSQNQTAIEELEKVKTDAEKLFNLDKCNLALATVLDQIDQQIKSLKGEK